MTGPLPRVEIENAYNPSLPEQDALDRMFRAWDDLRSLGWKCSTPPNDGADFWSVAPSSTGVHYTSRSGDRYWIYDGDLWPAKDICLWREMAVAP